MTGVPPDSSPERYGGIRPQVLQSGLGRTLVSGASPAADAGTACRAPTRGMPAVSQARSDALTVRTSEKNIEKSWRSFSARGAAAAYNLDVWLRQRLLLIHRRRPERGGNPSRRLASAPQPVAHRPDGDAGHVHGGARHLHRQRRAAAHRGSPSAPARTNRPGC